MNRVGAVVIGRNEANKLPRCLASVCGGLAPVVYVDSGSTDGSADVAHALGVDVVKLDPATPFTVARARNEGFARLTQLDPAIEFVQFVDADSEIVGSWAAAAATRLAHDLHLAVTFGRVQERWPQKSLYNRLYQISFDPRLRDSDRCGGMAMMRVAAFRQAGGFNRTMLGFEDYELCFRLRRDGWRIVRLDETMALHEAAMTRFAQWWQRAVRSGHARGHEAALHGATPARYSIRECRSIWFWGLLLPAAAFAAAASSTAVSMGLLAAYPLQCLRIFWRTRRRGVSRADAALWAFACVLAKVPAVLGLIRFHVERRRSAAVGVVQP